MINSSPDRFTFQANKYKEQLAEEPDNKVAADWIDFYNKVKEEATMKIQCEEWQKENLEYDLRSTGWVCSKAKASASYAQNLYSAMCNNSFVKNGGSGKLWDCSWRYAGGIVADMLEVGDYIDWYCSGIRHTSVSTYEQIQNMNAEELSQYREFIKYVGEGLVTEEIEQDLYKIGWVVIQ